MSEQNTTTEIQPATPTAIDRLESLELKVPTMETNISNILSHLNNLNSVLLQMNQTARNVQEQQGLITTISNGVSAIMQVLENKGVITSSEVGEQVHVILQESKLETERDLLSKGAIKEGSEVTVDSMVAVRILVRQTEDGEFVEVNKREHMFLGRFPEEARKEFLGAKVGDLIEKSGAKYEVLAIFNPVMEGSITEEQPTGEQKENG